MCLGNISSQCHSDITEKYLTKFSGFCCCLPLQCTCRKIKNKSFSSSYIFSHSESTAFHIFTQPTEWKINLAICSALKWFHIYRCFNECFHILLTYYEPAATFSSCEYSFWQARAWTGFGRFCCLSLVLGPSVCASSIKTQIQSCSSFFTGCWKQSAATERCWMMATV